MKQKIILLLLAILIIPTATAINISLTTDPTNNATTTQTINCLVTATATGTLTTNITWYVDGTPHPTDNETLTLTTTIQNTTTNIGALETTDTTKNEIWTCQATVGNTTHTNTTNTTITIINSAPVVTSPITAQTSTEDTPFGPIAATATDPDGDGITTWLSSDLNETDYGSELFTITTAGVITFTPGATDIGNHTIALLAGDGELFGGRNVIWEVLEYNDPPTLQTLTDQNATQAQTFNYVFSASDEEGDPFNFTFTSNLSSIQLIQVNATHAVINFTTGAPAFGDGGRHSVNITVYETGNASHNTTGNFTLTVFTINNNPVLNNIVSPVADQGDPFAITINASDLDLADTLNFTITTSCSITNPWTLNITNNNATNATAIINTTLNNNHVICRNVTVTVRDYELGVAKTSDNQTILLNISNTNDAPAVNEKSNNGLNTEGGANLTNLTAPEDIPYTYFVNASDPDELTYEGEVLSYADNTSLFDINSTTGEITFTPSSGGTIETVLITVTDDEGLNDSRVLTITLVNNTPPLLLLLANTSCSEDSNCTFLLEATDIDVGENLTFVVNNVVADLASNITGNYSFTSFQVTYNTTRIWRNFTNLYVGNYTYNISVLDQYGAEDNQLWGLNITNTNDAPFFDRDLDGTPDTILPANPIVVTYEALFYIHVTDDDLSVIAESLSLNTSIAGPNTTLFTPAKTDENTWEVRFTPQIGQDGIYTVNFTVVDGSGANDSQIIGFTVHNQSVSPNITSVQPFYNVTLGGTELYNVSTALFNGSTTVTLSEGSSYTFNITYTDPDTPAPNITINWFIDGVLNQSTLASADFSFARTFTYFESGSYVYVVNVTDEFYETDTFTWNVTVQDVNRPPILLENLTDRSINQTTLITDYMDVFYDPDDDVDSNGTIDGSETNSLIFTNTVTTYLDIVFSGIDTTFTPLVDGVTTVTFTATDGDGLSVNSNDVEYNVSVPPDEDAGGSSGSGGGGGGGGGGSSSSVIPFPVTKEPEPFTIDLLSPLPLVVYYNDTIAAPITVRNPTDISIRTISFRAEAPVDNVTFDFSVDTIELLEPGEEENITLYISNYRSAGTYEIKVIGEAVDPEVNDSAILFINSLEKGVEGDAVQTKVTFARDLLSTNPECLELNELLNQAERAIETGQYGEAQDLISAVVDGCRYLVTESAKREEVPGGISLDFFSQFRYANIVLAALLILLIGVAALLFLHYYSASKHEEE